MNLVSNVLIRKAKKIETISTKKLLANMDIQSNPLAVIFVNKYSRNNRVELKPLVKKIYNFLENNSLDAKLKFLFDLYDSNGDNKISNKELFDFLKIANKFILSDKQIQDIVDRTFANLGEYKSYIDYTDFKNLILQKNKNFKTLFLNL